MLPVFMNLQADSIENPLRGNTQARLSSRSGFLHHVLEDLDLLGVSGQGYDRLLDVGTLANVNAHALPLAPAA